MAFLHGDLDPNCVRQTESQDNGQEDLDFSYLFHYSRTEFTSGGGDGEDSGNCSHPVLLSQQREDSYPPDPSQDTDHLSRSRAGLDPLELQANGQGPVPAPSPRIEITPSWEPFQPLSLDCSPSSTALTAYREQQCLSPASSNSSTGWLAESNSPWASPCVSPSGGGGGVGSLAQDLCPGHQGLCTSSSHTSPGTSPRHSITEETFQLLQNQRISSPSPNPNSLSHLRSRSASPQGKRTYDQYSGTPGLGTPVYPRSRSPSPSPSPQIPLGSHHQLQPPAPLELQAQDLPNLEELLSNPYRAVSSKMVRNSKESYVWGETQEEGNLFGDNQTQDSPYGDPGNQSCLYADTKVRVCEQERRGRPGTGPGARLDTLYVLPPTWSSPLANDGALSVPAVSSVLPLDWPVPSQAGKYHLQILQQPRSHHRAHYETEGSRGPVKAPGGGHPEVQLCGYRGSGPLGLLVFIGTADEKVTRPHAFYQVHRITGKTVTTPSLERTVHGTQALELTLEPSNNMRAVIDCAGILKLRNADIEMRNGETNIGRKNTRVSLVFRVHIPEPAGHVVTLQVASQPIECSQRSAQEYPRVENQDLECCSVLGGQQMILVGQNFTSESRVVFTEMTNEDVQMWEAEAKVDRDKSQPNILFVEVPPYRDLSLHQAVQVTFCVMNGRRKCSLYQPFTYTPLTAVKTEPVDDYQYSLLGCAVSQASRQAATPVYHTQSTHFTSSHHPVPGMAPFQHRGLVPNHSDSFYQAQYKPLPGYHPTSTSYAHQPPGSGAFTAGNPAQTTRPQLGHPGQAPQPGHQSQVLNFSHHAGVGALGSDHHQQTRPDDGQYLASVSPCFVGASPGASGGQRYRGYVQVQTVLPLGSSPPCYTQGLVHKDLEPRARSEQDQDHSVAQRGPAPSCLSRMIPGKITIKQENLNQNYLDDVNDLISSDL